jgi:hypothetical protein
MFWVRVLSTKGDQAGNPSAIGIGEAWEKCPQANSDDDNRSVHLGNARATHPYRTPVRV